MSNEIKPTRRGFLAGALALIGMAPAAARAAAAPSPPPEPVNPFDGSDYAGAVDAFGKAGEQLLPLLEDGGPVAEVWTVERAGTYAIQGHVYPELEGVRASLCRNGVPVYEATEPRAGRYGYPDGEGVVQIRVLVQCDAGDRLELLTTPPAHTSFHVARI